MSIAETFVPRSWQEQIIGNPPKGIPEDTSKFKVAVAHRKAGKSVMGLMYLFMQAVKWQREKFKGKAYKQNFRVPRFTYIGPTYKQAKDIAWDLLKDIVPKDMVFRKPNETQLELRLTSGAILNIKGADNEDSLRGPGLQFALLDEVGYMKPHVWESIIQPELASTNGGAMFIGTPNGRDKFYELYARGRDGQKDWKSWLLPATNTTLNFSPDTPRGPDLISPEALEEARLGTSEKFYRQEYECEFRDDAGMVFDRVDEAVIDEFREYPETGHRYRIGVDPALREDWTVIVVLDLTDRHVKYVYRTNKIDLELLIERIHNASNTWTTNAGRPEIVMDTTGMGDPIYEMLTSRGVAITPVKFTNERKNQMVKNLAMLFERMDLKFPRYDWLIDELKDYRYERLPISGKYRYGAPAGKHDDGVSAMMLAVWQLPPKSTIIRPERNYRLGTFNKFTGVAH